MDLIADSLARIRNASMKNKETVNLFHSKQIINILEVLKQEGYINGYKEIEIRKNIKEIEVSLKYYKGKPVIEKLRRVSKLSRRNYVSVDNIPVVNNGLGIAIISTSKGVMASTEAKKANVGGEVICTVF